MKWKKSITISCDTESPEILNFSIKESSGKKIESEKKGKFLVYCGGCDLVTDIGELTDEEEETLWAFAWPEPETIESEITKN